MSYSEVMELPIRAFWFMNDCVTRLTAEEDVRSLMVANSSEGEGAEKLLARLNLQMGDVMTLDPVASAVRDEEGFNELKMLKQGF